MPMPGPGELIVILLIVLVLFGSKKLPELSRSVGQSITNFRQGLHEASEEDSQAAGDGQATGQQARTTAEGGDADGSADEEPRQRGDA